MSESLLMQCHDQEISCEPVHRIAAAAASCMCCASNRNSVKKSCVSRNNDPLQDYIWRTIAGKGMCRSNERVPIVYSTLSKEKDDQMTRRPVQKYTDSTNEATPRRYFITSTRVRSNPTSYHHPYLEQKPAKYVLINRNGFKGVFKSHPASRQFNTKEEAANKICSITERLDFIEQYITLNTNRFGYVALNETILKELGTAIIECLSRKITASKVKCETLYEPISPAGCSEDED